MTEIMQMKFQRHCYVIQTEKMLTRINDNDQCAI